MAPIFRPAGVLALALVLTASCGGTTPVTQGPSTGTLPSSSVQVPGQSAPAASFTAAQSPLAGSGASPAPGASEAPGEAAGSPGPLDAASGAAACSGNHDNRVFFEAIAGQVSWAVYCAVLPAGWYVQAGSFALRGGGRMDITYHGPNGALLTLAEGALCPGGGAACAPVQSSLGSSAFGDQTGTLVSVGGGYAIYVNPGASPAWSATGTGLSESTFTQLVAALYHVQV